MSHSESHSDSCISGSSTADSSTAAGALSTLSRGVVPSLSVCPLDSDVVRGGAATDSGESGADTLIIPAFKGASGLELAGGLSGTLDEGRDIELWKLLVSLGARGTFGEVTKVPAAAVFGAEAAQTSGHVSTIVAIGLGDSDDVTAQTIREAAGIAIRAVSRPDSTDEDTQADARVVSMLGILDTPAALLGHALGAYTYAGQKQAKPVVGHVTVVASTGEDGEDLQALAEEAMVLARWVCFARDLVNAPANLLYPQSYAEIIAAAAKDSTLGTEGLECEILAEEQLREQGFGGIIAVGQGSSRSPRLVRLSYNADREDLPLVALVGKGITFDTGGISIKPAANMWHMISDMGGSAAVVGAVLAAAQLKVNVRVIATIPLAENMPGDSATRPGDIIRHYGGVTSEVLNTDAEGRLVLADAIVRACEDKPDFLMETATLTGAQMVALGERTPGIMGSIDFRDHVSVLSQEVGDNGWPMPLPKELGEALKSDVADLRNISNSRWGGMSVAGHYLAHFVADGVQWVHMDVAGPAYNSGSAYGYTPKRGTGVPVRTIVATLQAIADGRIGTSEQD